MKIGYYLADQNPQRDRSLGITAYTDGLIQALVQDPNLTLSAVVSASSYRPPAAVRISTLPMSTAAAAPRLIADNFHPLICRDKEPDLWHYPKGHLPLPCRYGKPTVITVHDLILQYYADRYPRERSALAYSYWTAVLKRSIPRSSLVLTVSHASEVALRSFCERHRLECPPIRVTYESFAVTTKPVRTSEKEDVVVHLASRERHKQTSTLLKFWEQLTKAEAGLPTLTLLGNLRPEDAAFAATLPSVKLCGRLPRLELEATIARARALVFPSEIEGFGLPTIEAYVLGTPVVYVLGTAVEEILGEGTPGGFVLSDFESFRAALRIALDMTGDAVQARSQQLASRYSWEACAALTKIAYRELAPR
jgi:glycosyltransferase involved in cell wall biosynthesis